MKVNPGPYGPFRDVCNLLQKFRDFLLGRAPHLRHNRFMPWLASRSLPDPDIPRGPEYKYSDQYYFNRDPADTVKPPKSGIALKHLSFSSRPTPGVPYWWDAHCYYEEVPDLPPRKPEPRAMLEPDIPSHIRRRRRELAAMANLCDPCRSDASGIPPDTRRPAK